MKDKQGTNNRDEMRLLDDGLRTINRSINA